MFVNKIRGKKQSVHFVMLFRTKPCRLIQTKGFPITKNFFLGGGAGGKSRTSATVFFNLGQARVLMVTFINFCIYKTVFVITNK